MCAWHGGRRAGSRPAADGNRRAREVERVAARVDHHLHDVRVAVVVRVGNRRGAASPSAATGRRRSGATTSSIIAGSMSGSSPCTLTTMSHDSSRATSAMRSVPVRCVGARHARDAAEARRPRRRCARRRWPRSPRPRRAPAARARRRARSSAGRTMSASGFAGKAGRVVAGGDDGDDGGSVSRESECTSRRASVDTANHSTRGRVAVSLVRPRSSATPAATLGRRTSREGRAGRECYDTAVLQMNWKAAATVVTGRHGAGGLAGVAASVAGAATPRARPPQPRRRGARRGARSSIESRRGVSARSSRPPPRSRSRARNPFRFRRAAPSRRARRSAQAPAAAPAAPVVAVGAGAVPVPPDRHGRATRSSGADDPDRGAVERHAGLVLAGARRGRRPAAIASSGSTTTPSRSTRRSATAASCGLTLTTPDRAR